MDIYIYMYVYILSNMCIYVHLYMQSSFVDVGHRKVKQPQLMVFAPEQIWRLEKSALAPAQVATAVACDIRCGGSS